MNFNWILGILVYKKVLTEDEASELSKRFATSIQSQTFNEAIRLVNETLDKLSSKRLGL